MNPTNSSEPVVCLTKHVKAFPTLKNESLSPLLKIITSVPWRAEHGDKVAVLFQPLVLRLL